MKEPKISRKKLKKAHDVNYKVPDSDYLDKTPIKGHDFNKEMDLDKFVKGFATTGMQATNIGASIEVIKKMRKEKVTIFFAFNSNMVTSGLREVIAYLVKNKLVQVLVTTAGGVEEDIMKTFKPFLLGDFKAPGKILRKHGINRTGNIFIPNDRYIEFEALMQKLLERLNKEQKETGKIHNASEIIYELGKEIKDENSIYYWATKNNIPTFCPALTDGAIGDNIYFFKEKDKTNKDFKVDIADDIVRITNTAVNSKKTGMIILGGGFVKHHTFNANLLRDGADYAVLISTETEEGGSDSGARLDEAVSWGKIKTDKPMIKVYADATIAFPIIVAGAFK